MITLRDYQEHLVDGTFRYFADGGKGNPVLAAPTGTGKSVVIGEFIRRAICYYPETRILKLTHVKELIAQNFAKLLELWPTAPAGIYSAGLGQKDVRQVTFAGIASAVKRPEIFGHIDLVIIDECHLVSPKEGTMYQDLIAALRAMNPSVRVIGLTATKWRMGQGLLIEPGGLFTDIAVDLTTLECFNWFIDSGYLVELIPKATKVTLDVDTVPIRNGEYALKELQIAVDKEEITRAALSETIELARISNRRHWLFFASGIEHTEHVAETLCRMGVMASYVHSKVSDTERDSRIESYKRGDFTAMVNNGILTTGFDFPGIDLIAVLRPTQSPGLWVQLLGRGTRPVYLPGVPLDTVDGRLAAIAGSVKPNCLVLDFAGNTKRLGPINDPVLPKKRKKGGRGGAPVKICAVCGVYLHTSVRSCKYCGYEFPQVVRYKPHASTEALIKRAADNPAPPPPVVTTYPVDRMVYAENRKPGKVPSLKVTYHCGLRSFKEWVCLEHTGFVKHKGRDWWRAHATNKTPPETVAEAMARIGELYAPARIVVKSVGAAGYPEVIGHEFNR